MSMCYVNRERDQVERIRYRFDETMRSVNGRNFPTAYGYHPTSVGVDRKHWLLCGGTGSRKIPTKLFETFHDEIDSIRKYNKVKQTHSVARHVDLVKEDYHQITLQTHVSSAIMTITYRHGTWTHVFGPPGTPFHSTWLNWSKQVLPRNKSGLLPALGLSRIKRITTYFFMRELIHTGVRRVMQRTHCLLEKTSKTSWTL